MKLLLAASLLVTSVSGSAAVSLAQQSTEFHDTGLLKPPAGAKVAVYEFEDLECPKCGHDAPLIHATCARLKVPLVRKDYPWFFHAWAKDAAINARFLQDSVSPATADVYRADVFSAQNRIASRDDLQAFTKRWYADHRLSQPFALDPAGKFAAEVQADHALGDRIGVHATPTLFVVTATTCVNVPDATQLAAMVEVALQQRSPGGTVKPSSLSNRLHAVAK